MVVSQMRIFHKCILYVRCCYVFHDVSSVVIHQIRAANSFAQLNACSYNFASQSNHWNCPLMAILEQLCHTDRGPLRSIAWVPSPACRSRYVMIYGGAFWFVAALYGYRWCHDLELAIGIVANHDQVINILDPRPNQTVVIIEKERKSVW